MVASWTSFWTLYTECSTVSDIPTAHGRGMKSSYLPHRLKRGRPRQVEHDGRADSGNERRTTLKSLSANKGFVVVRSWKSLSYRPPAHQGGKSQREPRQSAPTKLGTASKEVVTEYSRIFVVNPGHAAEALMTRYVPGTKRRGRSPHNVCCWRFQHPSLPGDTGWVSKTSS